MIAVTPKRASAATVAESRVSAFTMDLNWRKSLLLHGCAGRLATDIVDIGLRHGQRAPRRKTATSASERSTKVLSPAARAASMAASPSAKYPSSAERESALPRAPSIAARALSESPS